MSAVDILLEKQVEGIIFSVGFIINILKYTVPLIKKKKHWGALELPFKCIRRVDKITVDYIGFKTKTLTAGKVFYRSLFGFFFFSSRLSFTDHFP